MLAEKKYEELISILPTYIENTSQIQKSIALSDLAICYTQTGRYIEAEQCYENAIALSRSIPIKDRIRANFSNYLISVGAYDKALGQLAEITTPDMLALKLINEAHALYLKDPNNLTQCINKLDSCLTLCDNSTNSEAFYAKQNKAFILHESKLYLQARNSFTDLLSEAPDDVSYYRLLGNLALTQAKCGDTADALLGIDRAIKFFDVNDIDYNICLRKKAEILLTDKDPAKATIAFKHFFDAERSWLIKNLNKLSASNRLNMWGKEKPLLSKCFLLEDYAAEFLYDVAMFRRQTSLLGMHDSDNLTALLSASSSDLRKTLGKNDAAIEFVSYTASDEKTWYAAIVLPKRGSAKFVKLFDEDFIYQPDVPGTVSLIDAVKSDHARDKNLLYTDTVLADKIWSPIIAALPENTSKVYFAPEGIFHFLGIENMPFSGRERLELHRVSSTAALPYRKTTYPRFDKALLIGGLDYSALPEDSVSQSYNHEASDLLRQKVGGNNVFRYLPGTRSEVDSINTIISNSDITYDIGEASLKQVMPDFDMIHIATHGYSLNLGIRKRPEFAVDSLAYDMSLHATGLALSGANVASQYSNREDCILSAREICDLDLSDVDFVVLSACQTAQGDISDEGAAGLVRGLKNAGVKTVLASLWSVDDKSTMLFMQEFYRLLNDGKTKHEAYVGAQEFLKGYEHSIPQRKFSPKTLSREREPRYITTKYDAPYYWAPFIIIDDI